MKVLVLLMTLLSSQFVIAQDRYDQEVTQIAGKINAQVIKYTASKSKYGTLKIALVGITNEDNKQTKLTDLLEEELVVNLANESEGRYQILDRNYISQIIQEKNIPRDFGNKRDFAKNLGRFKAADLMIVGKLTNADNEYKLIFSFLETSEGITVGGAVTKITATEFLKKKNGEMLAVAESNTNTSDKNPSASNEQEKKVQEDLFGGTSYSDLIDEDCITKKTGTLVN